MTLPTVSPALLELPLSGDELEELADLLAAENLPETTFTLEELDGFLSALVAGPRVVGIEEYLPIVFGSDEDFDWESAQQEARFLELLQRLHAEIARSMLPSREERRQGLAYAPLLSTPVDEPGPLPAATAGADTPPLDDDADVLTREGDWLGREWAVGFLEVIHHFQDEWADLLEDEEANALLVPMILLQLGYSPDLPGHDPDFEEAVEMATEAVPTIAAWWRGGAVVEAVRGSGEPGRNDPCPCGSGKKYKKCCGAVA